MGKKKNYAITDGLMTIKKGMLLFALAQYFNLQQDEIVGISDSKKPEIVFTKKGMELILSKVDEQIFLTKNIESRSIKITNIDETLRALSSQVIFNQFPKFFLIADETKYADLTQPVVDVELIERCNSMQIMWKKWGNIGLPHLISSHQALQRLLATKMIEPIAHEFNKEYIKDNGLSIEYQCEIYANHLYGAKLLDIWHEYLLSMDPIHDNPNKFLDWVSTLSSEKLQQFGIHDLNEIPEVNYMVNPEQRAPWLLNLKEGNIIEGTHVPCASKPGEELEIIYTLGGSEKDTIEFYGGPKKRGTINHSSFFGGAHVDGAGRILLKSKMNGTHGLEWFFHAMDNNSGHIKPNDQMTLKILEKLESQGLDLNAILWSSKWGSVGQEGETAAIALQRLRGSMNQSELSVVKSIEYSDTSSKRLAKIAEFARKGGTQELHNYLTIRSFKITVDEAKNAALLIRDALHQYSEQLHQGLVKKRPKIKPLEDLGDLAVVLLKNIGISAPEFENEVTSIIDDCKECIYLKFNQSGDSFFPPIKETDVQTNEVGDSSNLVFQ